MKKALILGVMIVFSLFVVSSAYAAKKPECPQPRKTKLAPGGISKKDKTGKANLANGKKLYLKTNIGKHSNAAEAAGYAIVSDLFTTNITINLTTGNFFEIDLQDHSADIHSITITESLTTNQTQNFYLKFTQGSYGRKFNWSAITNIKWPGASGPAMTGPDNTVDILKFTTFDQGTRWYGETIGQNFS